MVKQKDLLMHNTVIRALDTSTHLFNTFSVNTFGESTAQLSIYRFYAYSTYCIEVV